MTQLDNSQISFCWATFCRTVLEEPDSHERTIYGVMPGMRVMVGFQPDSEIPEIAQIPIGSLCVHAVLQRSVVRDLPESFMLETNINLPGQSGDGLPVECKFDADVEFAQVTMKFANVTLEFPSKESKFRYAASVEWKVGNKVLGSARMPISIEVIR